MGGVFAPANTPPAIVQRLNVEMVRVLQSASTRERLATGGLEAVGSSAEQFATAVKNDMTRMGKVIRDAGIPAQ